DASNRSFEALHLAHDEPNVFGRGDEENLVAVLDDRIALRLDALSAAIDRRHPRVVSLDVRSELLELLADERAALAGAHADEPNEPIGKVEHLQGSRMLDQAHDVIGHELLGADRHIDAE